MWLDFHLSRPQKCEVGHMDRVTDHDRVRAIDGGLSLTRAFIATAAIRMQIDHNIISLMSPSSVPSRKTPLWRKRRRKCMYFCNGVEFCFLHICLCLRLPIPPLARLPSYLSLALSRSLSIIHLFPLFTEKEDPICRSRRA